MGDYHLEIERVVEEIRKNSAKKVCLQLPDGLKPRAKELTDKIRKKTDAEIIIWGGGCFGACDIPKNLDVDLLIQFGHSKWR